jgi:hypothetical protein
MATDKGCDRMQVNQLAASFTQPSGTSNAVKEKGDAYAKSDFMKLVEQLTYGSDCDDSMLQNDGTLSDSNTYESNTCGNPMVLIKDNNGKQKGTRKTDDNQQQTLSPQLMQEIASMQALSLQATASVPPPIIVNQNPTDEMSDTASTQKITALNSLENAIQQGQSATNSTQSKQNSEILQVAQLIVNMNQASNDASTDSNATMLDAKALKVLSLFTQAAQKLIKADTTTDEQPMPPQKAGIVKAAFTDEIQTNKPENQVNVQEQQAATIPLNTIPLQIIAQTIQNSDITRNNSQTENKQDSRTVFIKTNVKDTGVLDTGQAGQIVSNKDMKANSQTISASEFQTKMNEFSGDDDLQRLFAELNIRSIQSNVKNGQKAGIKHENISQLNEILTAQPMITTSTKATQMPQTTQALLSMKALCEKAPNEVNTILKAAGANTLQEVIPNSITLSPKVGSITPFQFEINNKNAVIEPKTDKRSEDMQNGEPQNGLKLTQEEAFKHVLTATDKNQGDEAKSYNRDTMTGTQDKAVNDMNVNGTGNVQAFSVSTIESPSHSQAQSIVRQSSNAIAQAVSTNLSNFKVHLCPEDLGGITIKMVSKNGTISIQIIADNPHTGQLLSSSIGDLNTAIGQHGITVGKSEILSTGSNSNFFSTGDFSGHRQQTGQQQSQQQTQRFKQSESSSSWKMETQIVGEQVNQVIPQVLARSYDIFV